MFKQAKVEIVFGGNLLPSCYIQGLLPCLVRLTQNNLLYFTADTRFSIHCLGTWCTRTNISLTGILVTEQTYSVLFYTALKGTRASFFFIPLPTTGEIINTAENLQKEVLLYGESSLHSMSWRTKQPSPYLTANIFLRNSPDHRVQVFNPCVSSLTQEKLHYTSLRESDLKISTVQFQLC